MNNKNILAIGTYTHYVDNAPGACGDGILLLSFNNQDGTITTLSHYPIINPAYLSWSPQTQTLYCCHEDQQGRGQISNFSISESHQLTALSQTNNHGSPLCFNSTPDANGTLYAASYRDGAIYKISQNNNKLTIDYIQKYSGRGPNTTRQTMPHAHQVVRDPQDHYIYSCDLGSDKVWIDDSRNSTPTAHNFLVLPPGYGPRHLVFNDNRKYIYILCELIARVVVASVNNNDGSLKIVNDYSATHLISDKKSQPAAIKVHPSGKTLALSNRVINSISIFEINDEQLLFIEEFSSKGEHPRDINFSPKGDWLLIANQDSNDIQIRAFDPASGEPKAQWAPPYEVKTPTCIITL